MLKCFTPQPRFVCGATHITLHVVGLLGTNNLWCVPRVATNSLNPVHVLLVEHLRTNSMLRKSKPGVLTFNWSCSAEWDVKPYITEDLIVLAGTDCLLLLRRTCPLVQVGAVEDITQHVLTPLGHLVGNDIRWDVDLGLVAVVILVVEPLWMTQRCVIFLSNPRIKILEE